MSFDGGNKLDGKHYWLTPPDVYDKLNGEFNFNFDPCPYPKPDDFDGLTADWGTRNYVNIPFGVIIRDGKSTAQRLGFVNQFKSSTRAN